MHSEFEKEGKYKFTDLKAVPFDLLAVNKSIRQLWKSGEYALKQYVVPKNLKGPFESLIKRFIGELKNIQETIGEIAGGTEEARLNYEKELDETKGELDEAKANLGVVQKNLVGAQRDLDKTKVDLESTKEGLEIKINELTENFGTAQINLGKAKEELVIKQERISNLESETNQLKDDIQTRNQQQLQLRAQIANARRGREQERETARQASRNAQQIIGRLRNLVLLRYLPVEDQERRQLDQATIPLILIGLPSLISLIITQLTAAGYPPDLWVRYQLAPGLLTLLGIWVIICIFAFTQRKIDRINVTQKIRKVYKYKFTNRSILAGIPVFICQLLATIFLPSAFPNNLLGATRYSSITFLVIGGIWICYNCYCIKKLRRQIQNQNQQQERMNNNRG